MRSADRLASSRYGWLGAHGFIAGLYLAVWYFDAHHAISWPSPCVDSFPCETHLSFFTWGTTHAPLTSTRDLSITDRFTDGLSYSFAAASIIFLARRYFESRPLTFAHLSIIWSVAFALEAIFLTIAITWFAQTQDFFWRHEWPVQDADVWLVSAHALILTVITLVASLILFPQSVRYSSND